MNNVRFIIQISRGILRDQRVRRTFMFYSVVVVLVLLFLGSTLLWSWLRGHPLLFLVYWALCAWLTLLTILLALYDMARVRLEAKHRRRLEQEYLAGEKKNDDPHPR